MAMPNSLKALVAAARSNPGKFNFGSPGSGTLLHVASERLKQLTGAPITPIPYKGSGPAMQDLMGGTIEVAVGTLGGMLPLHRSGKMRLVGVATPALLPLASDITTVAESADLPTPFEAMLWHGFAVPRNTPAAIMSVLSQATQSAMNDTAQLGKLGDQGMSADLHINDSQASAFVKAETAKWKPIITRLGDLSKS